MSALGLFDSLGSHRILYLHNLSGIESSIYPNCISPERLESILSSFLEKGYRFISISEALRLKLEGKRSVNTISLSTDDGFASNHGVLLGMLKRLSIPLTLFLVGKCLDNQALAWNHKLLIIRQTISDAQINEFLADSADFPNISGECSFTKIFNVRNADKDTLADALWDRFMPFDQKEYLRVNHVFLSREQMMEWSANGAEFGLHSHTHADFSKLSLEEMDFELQNNRNAMDNMGLQMKGIFAFPYGRICAPGSLSHVCRQNNLLVTLGIRYSSRDNIRPGYLWQRQTLEFCGTGWRKELHLKPYLRTCKDLLRTIR